MGAGAGNIASVAPGSSGNVLTSNGSAWASSAAPGFSGWSEDGGNNDLLPASASAGIYLGVASATAANLLDDYEEGTCAIVFAGSTTAGSPTTPVGSGWYTKIGNHVHLDFQLYVTNTGGAAGALQIQGIPFTMNSHTSYRCGGSVGHIYNIDYASGDLQLSLYGGSSYTYVYPIFHRDGAGSEPLQVSGFTGGGWIMGSISYTV